MKKTKSAKECRWKPNPYYAKCKQTSYEIVWMTVGKPIHTGPKPK